MFDNQPLGAPPFAALGRASVEGWLAALDTSRQLNRAAVAELLTLFEATPVDAPATRVAADAVAELAGTAGSMARAQQTCWYLTGATLFGMEPRKTSSGPIRIDVDG